MARFGPLWPRHGKPRCRGLNAPGSLALAGGLDHAIQLLQNGLAIVGDNAGLYAALGHAYLRYREAGIDLTERPLDEAEGCARKVFALEPASASGLQLRGWIHYGRGRIHDAVHDLKAALAIEPNNADTSFC